MQIKQTEQIEEQLPVAERLVTCNLCGSPDCAGAGRDALDWCEVREESLREDRQWGRDG